MNQIICTFGTKPNIPHNCQKHKIKKKLFKIQFLILTIISIILIASYIYYRNDLNYKENFSKSIMDTIRNY